eukprot:TRINITY_DN51688_c0_g1_i3.p1 TRINITY_DN51688_c0_g1~~TRINITY_DN51688_c0_g1_i3.p1  ORF type:complete len:113 (-),score=12.05 TRINITY_DN51688_c0_g1_i3:150-488(-)
MGAEASKASPKALQQTHMMIEENRVMLFSKTFCPYCMKVKSLLNGLGIRPSVCELDKEFDGEEMEGAVFSISGRASLPSLFINGRFIGSCDDVASLHYNGRLIPMLEDAGIM